MADLTKGKDVAGSSFHVSDFYIWAEIFYLDSSTDYREYLPQSNRARVPVNSNDLIMLDDARRSSGSSLSLTTISLIALLLLLATGSFTYLITHLL